MSLRNRDKTSLRGHRDSERSVTAEVGRPPPKREIRYAIVGVRDEGHGRGNTQILQTQREGPCRLFTVDTANVPSAPPFAREHDEFARESVQEFRVIPN